MKKTCLIQHASGDEWRSLLRETSVRHAAYCDRHDINYLLHYGNPQHHRVPHWNWLPLALFALEQSCCDLVVVMDVDSIIVDGAVDLRDAEREFEHVGAVRHPAHWKAQDWHYNLGVCFLRNTLPVRRWLHNSLWLGQVEGPCGFYVQATLLELNDEMGGIIQRISDRWNSSKHSNEVPDPVVRSWHGLGGPDRLHEIREILAKSI